MLKLKVENLINETKEILNLCIAQCMSLGSIKNMGADELAMMQKAVNLMDTMEDYALEEAKTLDEINKKLDRLLDKKD